MRQSLVSAAIVAVLPVWALADMTDETDGRRLADLMRLGEAVDILREEGIAQAMDLGDTVFDEPAGPAWRRQVEGIYGAHLNDCVTGDFAAALSGRDMAPAIAFFESGGGRLLVSREIDARRTIMDPGVEAAAGEAARQMRAGSGPLAGRIEAFVAANDLIGQNIAGAMNASMAFYLGLAEGEAFGGTLTEDGIIADVYGQLPVIRDETEDWIYGFLWLAFGEVPLDVLDDYVALSETEAGQAMNAAIFAVFDDLYVDVSARLGRAAAAHGSGDDI